jgi:hypothetical protein
MITSERLTFFILSSFLSIGASRFLVRSAGFSSDDVFSCKATSDDGMAGARARS